MSWPFHPLPRGAYGVIVVDPPWHFRPRSSKGYGKSASQHYSLMTLDAIKSLPVADLAALHCLLLLWATQAQLHQGLAVMESWGFQFKTAGAWAKQSPTGSSWAFGTGYILRSAAEFFLIGTRGRPKIESHSERNLIVAPVREHSRKPDQAYAMLERLFPSAKRCELFARSTRPGWDPWGQEVGRFDDAGGSARALQHGHEGAAA
jgi:N6-adenosine-specific RNA methylase IME4